MTKAEDNTPTDKNHTPPATDAEAEFKSPEDEAHDAAVRQLEEADRTTADKAEEGDKGEAKAEAEEFEQVADDATDENAQAADGENLDVSDKKGKETVPLATLLEVRKKGRDRERELELELARQGGELDALKKNSASADKPEPEKPSPEQQIADLNAQIDQAWDDVDQGENTNLEASKKDRELREQIQTIERSSAPQVETGRQVVYDTQIETNVVELETKYPIIKGLTELEMQGFVSKAYQQAKDEGKPIRDGGLETMRLHNMTAKAAHDHYAQFFKPAPTPEGERQDTPSKSTLSSQGQTSGKKGLSNQAKDRADKMDFAASHPPDINQIGSAAEGVLNDDQILAKMNGMDETEQIEFLESMPGLAKRLGLD